MNSTSLSDFMPRVPLQTPRCGALTTSASGWSGRSRSTGCPTWTSCSSRTSTARSSARWPRMTSRGSPPATMQTSSCHTYTTSERVSQPSVPPAVGPRFIAVNNLGFRMSVVANVDVPQNIKGRPAQILLSLMERFPLISLIFIKEKN